jgi:malonate transporter and related proteins
MKYTFHIVDVFSSTRFALPALLLRLIAGQPLRQSFNPEFYTGYLASGAIIFVLVLGTSRVVGARDLSTAGAHATTATVSNLGFPGPPLMLAFFGERGAGPLAMAILAEVMVLLSVGSVLMGATGGPKRGIGLRTSSAFSAVRPARRHSSRSAGPSLCSVSTAEPPLPRA